MWKVRAYFVVTLAASVPLLLFSFSSLAAWYARERTVAEKEFEQRGRALAAAVDDYLASQVKTLELTAALPPFDNSDLDNVRVFAERLVDQHEDVLAIGVQDPADGHQVLNTAEPHLPQAYIDAVDRAGLAEVLVTRQPALSSVHTAGLDGRRPYFVARVPVVRNDKVRYLLSAAIDTRGLRRVIMLQRLRPGTLAMILTPDFITAAQSEDQRSVGKPAPQALISNSYRIGQGLFSSEIGRGVPYYIALERAPHTRWLVAVGYRADEFWAPIYRGAAWVGIVGLLCMAFGVLCVILYGRRVGQRVQEEEQARNADLAESWKALELALGESRAVFLCQDVLLRYTRIYSPYPSLRPERYLGKTDYDIFGREQGRELVRLKRDVMTSGKRVEVEHELFLPTVGWTYRKDVYAPLYDVHGNTVGLTGISLDLTDEYRRERELQAAKHSAQQANEAKSRFLAAASHDLRQPFQAMRLFLQVVAGEVERPSTAKAVAGLGKAMDAGEELLHSLLDLSTLDAGTVKVDIQHVCIGDLIDEVASECSRLAADKGLALRSVCSGVSVRTDPVLLKRMVRNLIHNAIRYTDKGRVLIGCRRRRTVLELQVLDTGRGIAGPEVPMIFEDFYQVDNPSRDRTRGLGLGLSVVKRTADLLGLTIHVASTPDRGSVFSILLPFRDGAEAAAAPPPRAVNPAAGVASTAGPDADQESWRNKARALRVMPQAAESPTQANAAKQPRYGAMSS